MDKKFVKLSPFSSRVKELARNLKMVSAKIEMNRETVEHLRDFVTDVIVLADELGPEQEELLEIASGVEDFLGGMDGVSSLLTEAKEKSDLCADQMLRSMDGYIDREVTNPYAPMFSPEEFEKDSMLIRKELIRLGHVRPALRKHIRPIVELIDRKDYWDQ